MYRSIADEMDAVLTASSNRPHLELTPNTEEAKVVELITPQYRQTFYAQGGDRIAEIRMIVNALERDQGPVRYIKKDGTEHIITDLTDMSSTFKPEHT